MSPDLFHAIMDRAQVEKRFPSVMLSLSAHDCHEIREVIADRDRLRSELDAARAELARARRQLLRRMGDAAMEKAKALEVAMNKERERRGKKWPSDVMRAFRRLNRMHGAVEAILRAEELARMEAQ